MLISNLPSFNIRLDESILKNLHPDSAVFIFVDKSQAPRKSNIEHFGKVSYVRSLLTSWMPRQVLHFIFNIIN